MNGLATYEALRQFAESWGLAAMVVCFSVCAIWPFRPGARVENDKAARMIFEDDDNG